MHVAGLDDNPDYSIIVLNINYLIMNNDKIVTTPLTLFIHRICSLPAQNQAELICMFIVQHITLLA